MQIKERGFTDMFLICVMLKVILKASKQILKIFLQLFVTIWHPAFTERVRKKSACTLLKKNGTGLANELKFDDCPYIFL